MASHRAASSLFVAFVVAGLAAGGGGFAISACSSETASGDAFAEGGLDATADARRDVEAGPRPPEEDSSTLTPAECAAKCKVDMPAAAMKYEAVDVCWAAKCQGPCVDGTGVFDAGAPADAGDDAGEDAGDDAGDAAVEGANDGGTPLCMSTYSSGTDKACDDCTEAFCCPAWDGCFNDQSCKDYNDCIGDCFQ